MGPVISDFEIKGTRYSTNYYTGSKSLEILAKLGKILTPGLLGLITGAMNLKEGQKNLNTMELISILVPGVANFFTEIDPMKLPLLIDEVLTGTRIIIGDRFEDAKSRHFEGRQGDLFLVLQEVLTFQYANFLELIVGLTKQAPAMMRQDRPLVKAL